MTTATVAIEPQLQTENGSSPIQLNGIEYRSFDERATLRDRTLLGYAAVFNSRTKIMSGIFEEIAPGAFTQSLLNDDIRLFVEHDPSKLLARSSAGTLRLNEDGRGLKVTASLPDTSLARDLATLMERGDLSGMSFGFREPEGNEEWLSWQRLEDGTELRTLRKLRLIEVSVVSLPAYLDTKAVLRSRELAAVRRTIPAHIKRKHELWRLKH